MLIYFKWKTSMCFYILVLWDCISYTNTWIIKWQRWLLQPMHGNQQVFFFGNFSIPFCIFAMVLKSYPNTMFIFNRRLNCVSSFHSFILSLFASPDRTVSLRKQLCCLSCCHCLTNHCPSFVSVLILTYWKFLHHVIRCQKSGII